MSFSCNCLASASNGKRGRHGQSKGKDSGLVPNGRQKEMYDRHASARWLAVIYTEEGWVEMRRGPLNDL